MRLAIPVRLPTSPYEVVVGSGLIAEAGLLCKSLNLPKRCVVIADETVAGLYAPALCESLKHASFDADLLTFPAGEPSKSLSLCEHLLEQMARLRLDRKAFLLALGGGVAGDITGFLASIYMRGIPYIQVPTTIVAQVDSAVGGKTGVNLSTGKNLVGAFHQPKLVIVDTATLESLPDREFYEGFAEVIKHAAIQDEALFSLLETFHRGDPIASILAANIRIKASIVVADERETLGQRALLNFGHTLGHAIEQAAGYGRLFHGEAVALGMRAAASLSRKYAKLTEEGERRLTSLIKRFRLPTTLPGDIATSAILEAVTLDKKFSAGAIHFVLLDSIGHAFLSTQVTYSDLEDAINTLRA